MSLWKRQETFAPAPLEKRVIGVPPESELVSWGWQEKTVVDSEPRTGHTRVRTADYRLLSNRRRTKWYIQWGRDGFIEPMQETSGTTEKTTPLGVIPRRTSQNSGRYRPAPDDRSIPIDEFDG